MRTHVANPDAFQLTTAEINYWRPDHPTILQQYYWQELDIAPRFPELRKFLDFWTRELDGKLHLVRVASASLLQPQEFRWADAEIRMN